MIYGSLDYLRLLREPQFLYVFVVMKFRFVPRRPENAKQHEELVLQKFKIKLKILVEQRSAILFGQPRVCLKFIFGEPFN